MESSRAYAPDDLGSTEIIPDPYPAYRAFRDRSPVRFQRVPGGVFPGIDKPLHAWALLRHADVMTALRDFEGFSANIPSVLTMIPRFTLLHDDPPRHTHLRKLVQKSFTPRRVTDLEPFIQRTAQEVVAGLGEGPIEIMARMAMQLPMRVICALLAIPPEQAETFRHWSEATIGYAGLPQEERRRRVAELLAYLGRQVADRRAHPGGDDLITALVEAELDGARLDDASTIGFCMTLLVAGNETTTGLIANCLHILAQHPDLWRRAREDRGLVDPILTETLRYASPTQRLPRIAVRPVEIGGAAIGAGDLVDIIYGAANRDPAMFEDPDTFRLDRPASEHVAFGYGTHFCVGAALAKVEARIALNAMLDRYARIELAAEPPVRQRVAFATLNFVTLPLVLHAS